MNDELPKRVKVLRGENDDGSNKTGITCGNCGKTDLWDYLQYKYGDIRCLDCKK